MWNWLVWCYVILNYSYYRCYLWGLFTKPIIPRWCQCSKSSYKFNGIYLFPEKVWAIIFCTVWTSYVIHICGHCKEETSRAVELFFFPWSECSAKTWSCDAKLLAQSDIMVLCQYYYTWINKLSFPKLCILKLRKVSHCLKWEFRKRSSCYYVELSVVLFWSFNFQVYLTYNCHEKPKAFKICYKNQGCTQPIELHL